MNKSTLIVAFLLYIIAVLEVSDCQEKSISWPVISDTCTANFGHHKYTWVINPSEITGHASGYNDVHRPSLCMF